MADFGGELDAFRAEARDWLEANFPPSLKGKSGFDVRRGRAAPTTAAIKAWTQGHGREGLGRSHLAQGLRRRRPRAAEARVLQQEMNAHRRLEPDRRHGRDDVRPDPARIRQRGAEAAPHPAPSSAAEVRWCQGFSEPGAGSDLASLQTKCRGQGRPLPGQRPEDLDLAARSGPTGASAWCAPTPRKKHEGISFLLIDMQDRRASKCGRSS